MRIGLDTNFLVHLAGVAKDKADQAKIEMARQMMARLRRSATIVVPAQVIGELLNVLAKTGMDRLVARDRAVALADTHIVPHADTALFLTALDLAAEKQLQFWDALILSTAREARCSLLLSEDMQDGFSHGGITIANPFAEPLHPRLAELLAA